MSESIWFTTRSALFRDGDHVWNEVAKYAVPLRNLIDRRYRWLDAPAREDVVHDVLIEMKQALVARHDPSRGKFRALLQTVVQRRVADRARSRRTAPLEDDVRAPETEEIEALDLETLLVDAVAACRDRLGQGVARDREALFVLADRLVHGKTSAEIAVASRTSKDHVARLLEKARDEIFRHLLAKELGLAGGELERALTVFRDALSGPGPARSSVESALDARIVDLVARLRKSLRFFEGEGSVRGAELRRGVTLVLQDPA